MWNLVTSNRLLGDIEKLHQRKKHLQRLKNIKASINNRPPKKPDTFLSKNRPKL